MGIMRDRVPRCRALAGKARPCILCGCRAACRGLVRRGPAAHHDQAGATTAGKNHTPPRRPDPGVWPRLAPGAASPRRCEPHGHRGVLLVGRCDAERHGYVATSSRSPGTAARSPSSSTAFAPPRHNLGLTPCGKAPSTGRRLAPRCVRGPRWRRYRLHECGTKPVGCADDDVTAPVPIVVPAAYASGKAAPHSTEFLPTPQPSIATATTNTAPTSATGIALNPTMAVNDAFVRSYRLLPNTTIRRAPPALTLRRYRVALARGGRRRR